MKNILILILVILLLPSFVHSADFGIAPSFETINFVPNSNKELNVRVYNHLNSSVTFSVFCSGELCNRTSFNDSISASPNSVSYFNFSVSLPGQINQQTSKLKFYFTPVQSSNNMISGVLSLGFELTVTNKLYNQDFDYIFNTSNNKLYLLVENVRDKQVRINYSLIVLNAYDNSSVLSVSKHLIIEPHNQNSPYQQFLLQSLKDGVYNVALNLSSQHNVFSILRNIVIGQPKVMLKQYSIKKESDSVMSLSSGLLLSWNKPLKAYIELGLYNNSNSKLIKTFKGELFNLSPGEVVDTKTFFEVPSEGKYKLHIHVHYNNLTSEKNITFKIIKTNKGYEVSNLNQIIALILLAVLVLINIILLWNFLKSKRKIPERVEQLINKSELAVLNNNLLEAKSAYYRIEKLYKSLPEDKKKQYHERILAVYNKIVKENKK